MTSIVENAIQSWAATYSAIEAIWRNEDGPQPLRPYIDLNVEEYVNKGDSFETLPNSEGVRTLYGIRDLVLSIRYFGPKGDDAIGKLAALLFTLDQIDVRAFFRSNDLLVYGYSGVKDTTFLEQAHSVERADAEVNLRTQMTLDYGSIDNIETTLLERVVIDEEYLPNDIHVSQTIPS